MSSPLGNDRLLPIEQEGDWVRREIRRGLERAVPIVPVLLDGASLPDPVRLPRDVRKLVHRQAFTVDTGTWVAATSSGAFRLPTTNRLESDNLLVFVPRQPRDDGLCWPSFGLHCSPPAAVTQLPMPPSERRQPSAAQCNLAHLLLIGLC
jgi:hypothetical protein